MDDDFIASGAIKGLGIVLAALLLLLSGAGAPYLLMLAGAIWLAWRFWPPGSE